MPEIIALIGGVWIAHSNRSVRYITRDTLIGFGGATLYTVVVTALVYLHILDIPDFLADLQP